MNLQLFPLCQFYFQVIFFPLLVGLNLNFSILFPIVNAFSNYCILSLCQWNAYEGREWQDRPLAVHQPCSTHFKLGACYSLLRSGSMQQWCEHWEKYSPTLLEIWLNITVYSFVQHAHIYRERERYTPKFDKIQRCYFWRQEEISHAETKLAHHPLKFSRSVDPAFPFLGSMAQCSKQRASRQWQLRGSQQ